MIGEFSDSQAGDQSEENNIFTYRSSYEYERFQSAHFKGAL